MSIPVKKGTKLSADEAVALFRRRDTVAFGLATGQTPGLLEAIGRRDDWEDLVLYCGILGAPYEFLGRRGVRVRSGFFGPVERIARAAGHDVEYVAADFIGLERLALELRPRIVLAATTPPDEEGFLDFGLHSGAVYRPFLEAARDPERLAIAEANPRMPWVEGLPHFGSHRIHVSQVDAWIEHESDLLVLPEKPLGEAEAAIARYVAEEIRPGSTLQFGIGAVPDEIARILAEREGGEYGIHSEMISDGVMRLHEAGKVTNRKGLYDGVSVATFAFGSAAFYRWLDRNPAVRMLPVSAVNDPAVVRHLRSFVSVNAALAVDLLGQVAADYVGGRQYSGVGGQELFVEGARSAPGGKSFLCLRSVVEVEGKRLSTIVPRLPDTMTVTTPRHHVQYVVTEYGVANLAGLGDRERARALVRIAHPDFRGWLEEELPR